ncbi:hypothetical protein Tco_0952732 [Tanacetum coccineum]|uniref:Uncharacterized protein n=1 Tax=Tanacetum coccineum TaxID=301880 RepID=A0ABQ5DYM2_9ASTR
MIWSQNYPLVERKEGKRTFVTSDICLSQPPISQASESQHAEETEVTADVTQNIGDVPLESFHDADKSPYDTESEIKIVKRFKPTIDDEESLFTSVTKEHSVIGDESDLESMPMDEIGHPCLTPLMTDKLEEIVPSLVAETLKENLPKIISESLKIAILQIIAESVKEIIKPINKQFNTFNKLKAACFTKLHTGLKKDLKKKLEVSVRKEVHKGMETVKGKVDYCTTRVDQNTQHVQEMTTLIRDMVHILESASVFTKANAEGEKWDKASLDPSKAKQSTQIPDTTQGEHQSSEDQKVQVSQEPQTTEQVFQSSTDLVIHSL